MSPFKALALTVLLSLSPSLQPASAANNDPEDVAAIGEIVEAFRTSILEKDNHLAFIDRITEAGSEPGPRDVAPGPD